MSDLETLQEDGRITSFGFFVEAHARIWRALDRSLHESCDISGAWFEVLLRLGRSPGGRLTMSELAQQLAITSGGATRLIDRVEKAGYETCTASDGRQALELFEARRDEIRLLILDLLMPEMTGQEVARKVREMASDVPILFASGYVPEETQDALADPVLRKPYTIKDLTDAVNQLL